MLHFKQFGRYEIISKLGRGMSDVYLALDTAESRHAVLKIVEQSGDPWTQVVLEAERRGAQIQKQLHEVDARFLEIYDCGEMNGCYFVAMQYVEGKTLAEMLQAARRMDPVESARYAAEVCSQLDKLHSFQIEIDGRKRAVVHGDIKPSNIQICPDGAVRLLDFGISKAITFTHHLTYHNLGSPSYCSPERLLRAQVDPHSDLWALGATLYEMVAGFPPYQAQSTQKLEELIRSKRPPRALPESCPASLKAVIRKSLAGEMENRYTAASAMEQDLRLFLDGRQTLAETEKQRAWEVNPTVEKDREPAPTPAASLRPPHNLRRYLEKVLVPVAAVAIGAVVGSLIYIESAYAYRFWSESKPLRAPHDYTRRGIADVNADWSLYQTLERRNFPLGRFSPVGWLSPPLRSSLLAAADDVIERYRNSSDPSPGDFDWQKAEVCLEHAAELDGADPAVKGKLALTNGYMALLEHPQTEQTAARAKASFEEAVSYLPRSPDPHLGLARLEVYAYRNVGRTLAELSEAERLGFKLGPREFEEEADGYLLRAEQELQHARRAQQGKSGESAKYLSLAQGDLERARNLYEPIGGFSNVSANLNRLYRDRARQQLLEAQDHKAATPRKLMARRPRSWR
ncbi:MAG: serine/threonine protein kinase [Acidobacteriia bacterium]|nr:serine/threonine protein kinase [Terriglobia bacterium]